ncbi:hypothetical protein DRZ77_01420 [Candidatus Woesearchaeota archaeon]|nr:hypothetical protein [Candidatus Woesearchaeota archaeon]RLE40759.1 MAG: hypothetical protein DRZ77_01420 [Candidatus Woesearchaeota archaeon]
MRWKVPYIMIFFCLFSLIIPDIAFAENTQKTLEACVYFFYGQGCPHCARVEPYLETLEKIYPGIKIHRFEIYNNRTNLQLLMKYFDAYNVSDYERGVPVVFLVNKYFVGDKPILDHLLDAIKENNVSACPTLEKQTEVKKAVTGPASTVEQRFGTISMLTVIGAALVDSINPCAIAVLLILLSTLLVTGERKRALKAGIAFTISIYIVYFLFGLGLFSALQITGLSYWFYKFIGLLAIIIGILNIKDFFKYGAGGFVMEIPKKWRPSLQRLLRSVTSPIGAFFMGFLVCLFELPCTGGPYIFVLGLLAEKTTRLMATPILLIYNLFFILPLIIITLFVFWGFTTVEKAKAWKERNIRLLHLIAGLIMVALGVIVMSGLV